MGPTSNASTKGEYVVLLVARQTLPPSSQSTKRGCPKPKAKAQDEEERFSNLCLAWRQRTEHSGITLHSRLSKSWHLLKMVGQTISQLKKLLSSGRGEHGSRSTLTHRYIAIFPDEHFTGTNCCNCGVALLRALTCANIVEEFGENDHIKRSGAQKYCVLCKRG